MSIFYDALTTNDWIKFCCFGLLRIRFVNWVWNAINVGYIDLTNYIFWGNYSLIKVYRSSSVCRGESFKSSTYLGKMTWKAFWAESSMEWGGIYNDLKFR